MSWVVQRIAFVAVSIASLGAARAAVSTNVPLDHWSYDAVEKLADYGLIDSAMLTIRPITRMEMARHIAQATVSLERTKNPSEVLEQILRRLQEEFKAELIEMGASEGCREGSFVKPVEDPYAKYLYSNERPDIENSRGDVFREGSNYRSGFASRGEIEDVAAFYLHPEFKANSDIADGDGRLIEGYGKIMAGPVEIQAGKDSLWWGPARRGSMLMSNNAQPFTMIKLTNPQPVQLPWVLGALGPFRAEWFLAELEEDRDFSYAKLSGLRVSVKPHPLVELGASRTILFGGSGQPHVGIFDYGKMILATSNQAEDDQLAGFDASIRVPLGDNGLLRSAKFYMDAAGEDEAGALPSDWGRIVGVQLSDLFRTGRTDLRIEYADDHVRGKPGVFYTHSLYTSGYTYDGRVIGHYMGTDSRDLSITLSHYLTGDLVVDATVDRQTHSLTGATIDILECDVTFFQTSQWRLQASYRYENGEGGGSEDNQIVQLQLTKRF